MYRSIAVALIICVSPTVALADEVSAAPPGEAAAPSATAAHEPSKIAYVVPRRVAYQGGDIPAGSHLETKPDVAYIASGISIFGSAYATSLVYGLTTCGAQSECRRGSGWLYLPLVGPFVTSAQAPTTGGQALAAFDGGVQVLGLALTVVGFAVPRKYVTWQGKYALSLTPGTGAAKLPLSPFVAESRPELGGGLSFTVTEL